VLAALTGHVARPVFQLGPRESQTVGNTKRASGPVCRKKDERQLLNESGRFWLTAVTPLS
jgi:hypothetical protein